jgi:NTP pyrophosphatase (non-canonical NTP hydrolase)
MNMNEYQTAAAMFAQYDNEMYPVASLMVEAAELADLYIKPLLRGDEGGVDRKAVLSEAGDVLWNLTNILEDYGLTLEEVAQYNIEKLTDRQTRGVIKGSGDYR